MLDKWAALAAQGGGCRRGMCPLLCKAQEAKALIDINIPKKAIWATLHEFQLTFYKFLGGGTHPARLYADKPLPRASQLLHVIHYMQESAVWFEKLSYM